MFWAFYLVVLLSPALWPSHPKSTAPSTKVCWPLSSEWEPGRKLASTLLTTNTSYSWCFQTRGLLPTLSTFISYCIPKPGGSSCPSDNQYLLLRSQTIPKPAAIKRLEFLVSLYSSLEQCFYFSTTVGSLLLVISIPTKCTDSLLEMFKAGRDCNKC